MEIARTNNLNNVLPFEEGKVNKFKCYESEKGSVTAMAFAPGAGLDTHTAPCDAIVTVLEGEVEFTVGPETFLLTPGSMLNLQPGEEHSVRAITPARLTLTKFI